MCSFSQTLKNSQAAPLCAQNITFHLYPFELCFELGKLNTNLGEMVHLLDYHDKEQVARERQSRQALT